MTHYLLAVNGNLDEAAADTRTMEDYQPVFGAADLGAALEWVEEGSQACAGRAEVRPFQEEPDAAETAG